MNNRIFLNLILHTVLCSKGKLIFCEISDSSEAQVSTGVKLSREIESFAVGSVDLSVYREHKTELSKEELEVRLANFHQTMEEEKTTKQSIYVGPEEEGTSSGIRHVKKLKISVSTDENDGKGAHSSDQDLPQGFATEFENFLRNYLPDIVIMNFEGEVFGSKNLYLTNFWLDKRILQTEAHFVKFMVEYFSGKSYTENVELKLKMESLLEEKINGIKSELLPGFIGKSTKTKHLLNLFLNTIVRLECIDIKGSLVTILLIFEYNMPLLESAFLIFLLICSYRELQNMSFKEAFQKVINNESSLGSKILNVGGAPVKQLFKELRKHGKKSGGVKIKDLKQEDRIQFPLIMESVNVQDFGLRLCLSLLELAIIETSSINKMYLLMFFGSRMLTATEVFMAYDIVGIVSRTTLTIDEMVLAVIFESNTFNLIIRRIKEYHNVDLSELKSRFDECIQIRKYYPELNNFVTRTDFQIKAILKKKRKKEKREKKREKKKRTENK
ncbi:secreted protein of cryptosprodidium-specific FGLN protein family [Cryptosporidium felis]|nr:secreted protein of cryptosprodidium-specific FGLN protein family [Cryptosporidium felis]